MTTRLDSILASLLPFAFAAAVGCSASNPAAPPATCLGESMQCGGFCVDVMEDDSNCGACGMACGSDAVCSLGKCATVNGPSVCPSGTATCAGDCVDLTVDPANCGACGNDCGPGNGCVASACETRAWELLLDVPTTANLPDFTPQGYGGTFDVTGGSTYRYFNPAPQSPQGSTATLAAPPASSSYTDLAWVGTKLYECIGSAIYAFSIPTDTWTTPVSALTHTTSLAQAAHDDDGLVYCRSSDNNLIIFNTANNAVTYVLVPSALGLSTSEPRTIWDSKSKLLYLAAYGSASTFVAYDPVAGTFAAKASSVFNGFSDGMCSDRNGHVFSANQSAGNTMWMYTAATDSWSQLATLPFTTSYSEACTVSADGYLYFSSASGFFARLKL